MVNTKPVKLGKNIRQSFAHIDEVAEMPNLIEVQKNSYQWFLDEGLRAVFKDISSITDYQGNLQLDFIDFTLDDKPKYPLLECKERFGDERRTEICLAANEFNPEDFYANDEVVITISHLGYIKRTSLAEFKAQGRRGVGSKGAAARDAVRHEPLLRLEGAHGLIGFGAEVTGDIFLLEQPAAAELDL